jgi:DNA gyrase subunit A
MMAVKSGRAIRFSEEKVRSTGRGAIGVGGIEVDDENDEVIGMICVPTNAEIVPGVLVVSEKGFGKRTAVDEYRFTNRGGKGVKTINITDKTGNLVGLLDVFENQDLLITCKSGITIRMPVSGISELGRAAQGVKLIRIDEGDAIAAITTVDEQEIEETENTEETTLSANTTDQQDITPSDEQGPAAAGEEEKPEEPTEEN